MIVGLEFAGWSWNGFITQGVCQCSVSAYDRFGNESLAVEAMKAGAMDYIVKSPEGISSYARHRPAHLARMDECQKRKHAEEALRRREEQLPRSYQQHKRPTFY